MKKKIFVGIILALLICFYSLIHSFIVHIVPTWLDTKKVSCDELPSIEEVKKILSEHHDIIKKYENPSKGRWIEIDERCHGKADIIIYYDTLKTRKKIKKQIGNTFFGVPYRMFNI